jgi:enoyl-CoA hydratase/carnithine racemase
VIFSFTWNDNIVIDNNLFDKPLLSHRAVSDPSIMTQNLHPLLQRAQTHGIHFEMKGAVAMVRLSRPAKRNALNDGLVEALRDVFQNLPEEAKSAVVYGEGDHFCAGLDLSELKERDAGQGLHHSRSWHVALDAVQLGRVPVIAALHGAVVGGGLELASACHIRVADDSTFYALPEGTRGIFVGGGGSVRIPKLIGVARMTDMMLTGRVYNAVDGERIGLAQYHVPTGTALEKALELAQRIATNAALTNYALMHALPRIAEQPADHGYLTEALISSIAQSAPEAKARVRAFLEGKAAKVQKS